MQRTLKSGLKQIICAGFLFPINRYCLRKFNSLVFEMAQENVIFQQRITSKGKIEYRTKFGRQKALVFRQHVGFLYLELYDNKPGRSDKIGLGLDELDYLIQLRTNLETLKPGFTEVSPDVI